MRRGDVYLARLDPSEGSEQSGRRPVIVVSRDAINQSSPVVVVVPCTTYHASRRIYPSQVLLRAPEGGLTVDSIALGEQIRAMAKTRLVRQLGAVSAASMAQIGVSLLIALDLPGQILPGPRPWGQ